MPRVTEEHRRAQRERITAAALRASQEHGLAGVSMSEVIKESGLSAGAIYGYFKGKDEIVAAVATELVANRLAVIEALAAERPVPRPVDMVRRFVASVPAEVVDRGLVLEVWGAAARDGVIADVARDQLERFTAAMADYLTAYLEHEGRDPADAARLAPRIAPALAALAQGYMVRVAVEGAEGAAAYLDALDALAELKALR